MYQENFEHVGGTTAICEAQRTLSPEVLQDHHRLHRGDLWKRLLGQYQQPADAARSHRGEVRGGNRKADLQCVPVVPGCERVYQVSQSIARRQGPAGWRAPAANAPWWECLPSFPKYIYSTDKEGLFVNLYAASTIVWKQGDGNVTVTQATQFPGASGVTLTVATETPQAMNIRIRVPSWAAHDMTIQVNGAPVAVGKPGTYASIQRTWANKDVVSFSLPMEFTTVKYVGLDQAADNVDRYALLYGPILMALGDPRGGSRRSRRNCRPFDAR